METQVIKSNAAVRSIIKMIREATISKIARLSPGDYPTPVEEDAKSRILTGKAKAMASSQILRNVRERLSSGEPIQAVDVVKASGSLGRQAEQYAAKAAKVQEAIKEIQDIADKAIIRLEVAAEDETLSADEAVELYESVANFEPNLEVTPKRRQKREKAPAKKAAAKKTAAKKTTAKEEA